LAHREYGKSLEKLRFPDWQSVWQRVRQFEHLEAGAR